MLFSCVTEEQLLLDFVHLCKNNLAETCISSIKPIVFIEML